ncbi:MAG: serine hydrolase domain-containing protein [Bacteroidota bacterium]
MKKTIFLILLTFSFTSYAQLNDVQVSKIDSLFIRWNAPNSPGGAVGIMQGNKVVFKKAYGLASLEYQVPNTSETIFNIGSISKQFTAMGIILLEEQNLLSIDDDIRKHLPELPDFGPTITINHLINHTSGLRSLHALFGIAGWRGDDSRTNEDLNRIIKDQKELNFKPGDEYLYCNTGYMLMATIIERITGESFTAWMKKSVFEPLKMNNTYVEDVYQRIVANNATSYYMGSETIRAVEYWGYVGSGNVHSTTDDMLTWYSNFYKPTSGWKSAFEKMRRTKKFNDGAQNNYAFGVILDQNLGRDRIQHGGAIGGFRAYGCIYPEEETSIVVLTNFSQGNPVGYSARISDILFDDITKKDDSSPSVSKGIKLSNKALQKFEGNYWFNTSKNARKLYVKDDTLRYSRGENNETSLLPVAKNRFKLLGPLGDFFIEFNESEGGMGLTFEQSGRLPLRAERFEAVEVTDSELKSYVGTYRSPELETLYKIWMMDNEVVMYNIRHGEIRLNRIAKDKFNSIAASITFEFNRDNDDKVTEMLMSNGRARNVRFEKFE